MATVVVLVVTSVDVEYCVNVGLVTVVNLNDVAANCVSVVVVTYLVKACELVMTVVSVWIGVEKVIEVVMLVL